MKLEIGKNYRCRDGSQTADIRGDAVRPGAVWSLQGDWYEKETGARLFYNPQTGEHYTNSPSRYDLTEEAPPER